MRIIALLVSLWTFSVPVLGQILPSVKQGCGPLTVYFSDLTPAAASWSWDLGNGNTSSLARPTAIYTSPGKYTIKLVVRDNSGTIYNYVETDLIWVYEPPTIDFKASKRKFCLRDTVTFFENCKPGDAAVKSYSWDAGEGTLYSGKSPVINYSDPGFKNVVLVATDNNGCSASKKLSSYIQVLSLPDASFEADTAVSCRKPVKVTFTPYSLSGISSYKWDFGNGQTSSNKTPSTIYNKYGKYTVQLTLKDNNGCENSLVKKAVSVDSVSLNFKVASDIVCDLNTEIQFNNLSNISGTEYSWVWDLGDGTRENTYLAKHTYTQFGNYNVSLKLNGPNCQYTKNSGLVIKVNRKPKIDFVINDTGACFLPFKIKFKGVANMPVALCQWDFDDGGTIVSGNDISHSFNSDDTFKVKLFLKAGNGCSSDTVKPVLKQYISTAIGGVSGGCVIYKPEYRLDSIFTTSAVVKTGWIFNSKLDSGDRVQLNIPDTGIFLLRSFAVNSKGCSDTNNLKILVGQKFKPKIEFSKPKVCRNEEFWVYNKTQNVPQNVVIEFDWKESSDTLKDSLRIRLANTQKSATFFAYTRHLGCVDTTVIKNAIYVETPRVSYNFKGLGKCVIPDTLTILNVTDKYTSFSWSSNIPPYYKDDDSMIIPTVGYSQIILKMYAKDKFTGCEDSLNTKINIYNNKAIALAKLKVIDTCLPARIQLIDAGSKGQFIKWELSNGDSSVKTDPFIKLNTYGKHLFKRVSTNYDGVQYCSDTQLLLFNLRKPDIRNSISPKESCTPSSVTLIDSGYFYGRKASWKIGDSTIKSQGLINNIVFLQPPKTNPVKAIFKSYDSSGICFSYDTSEILIGGPQVEVAHQFLYTCKLTRLQLSPKKVKPFGVKEVEWIVDDTFFSDKENTEFLVYDTRTVNIKLKVTDSAGCSSIVNKSVFVRMYRPEVKFLTDIRVGLCPPSNVKFYDSSTAFNSPIQSWNWDFGDGTFSNLKNPAHTYYSPGNYTIKLQVKSLLGCFAEKTFDNYIQINGPRGDIIMDRTKGCSPLTVEFSSDAKGLADVHWDFGDGNEGYGNKISHIYTDAGIYTPSAILEDSAGCKLGIKALTSVTNILTPRAKISQLSFCEYDSLRFTDQSEYFVFIPSNNFQYDGKTQSAKQVSFKPSPGNNSLLFVANGGLGCNDTLRFSPRISYVKAIPEIVKSKICKGDSIRLKSLSQSDTTILLNSWKLGSTIYTGQTVNIPAQNPGRHNLKLKTVNVFGCLDSVGVNDAFVVGDTVAPLSLEPLLVSNQQNNEFSFLHRKSSDPAFDKYSVFIKDPVLGYRSSAQSTAIEDTFKQIIVPGKWHSSVCFKILQTNFCNQMSLLSTTKEHCSILLNEHSSNNVLDLNWTHYVGNRPSGYSLSRVNTSTMQTDWVKTFAPGDTSYIDSTARCKVNYRYMVSATFPGISTQSHSNIREAVLMNKGIPPLPFIKNVTVNNNRDISVFADTLNKTQNGIQQYDLYKSSDGLAFNKWKTLDNSFSAIDQNVLPSKQQYYYKLSAVDECGTLSPFSEISSPVFCKISALNNDPSKVSLSWSGYKYWPSDVNRYVIQSSADGVVFTDIGQTNDTNFLLSSGRNSCGEVPYYRIIALSNNNSEFSDQSVQVSYSNIVKESFAPVIYIPNAFTPNANNLNEVYKPEFYWVKEFKMSLFNRWGEKVYDGSGCQSAWDGYRNGQPAMQGVYIYHISVTGYDNKRYYYTGNLYLMR